MAKARTDPPTEQAAQGAAPPGTALDEEQRRREAAALAAELHDRYGVLFDGAPLGIGIALDGMVLHANPTLLQMLRYDSVDEVRGHPVVAFIAPVDRPAIGAALQRFAAGAGFPRHYQAHALCQDGTTFPVQIDVATIALPQGAAAVAFLTDVSVQVAAEHALRASEAQHRELSEVMSDLAVSLRIAPDGSFHREWASQSMDRFTGLTAAEREARGGWTAFIHPEDLPVVVQALGTAGAVGTRTGDCRMRRHDGAWRWFRHFVRAVRDEEQGRVTRIVSSAYDVTELRQAEEERAHNETLLRIGRDLAVDLAAARGLEDGVQLCLRAALAVPGMDGAGLYLADAGSGDFALAAAEGLERGFVERVARHAADSPQVALMQRQEAVFKTVDALEPELAAPLRAFGQQAVAALPLVHEGAVIGCINVCSRSLAQFPERTRRALETIAAQAGGAIARLRAEEGRRRSEERLRRYLALSPVPLATIRPDGGIDNVNRRFVELFGYPREELPTFSDWWQKVCADAPGVAALRAGLEAQLAAAGEGDELCGGEVEVLCKDGSKRLVDLRGARIGDRLVASFADLTPYRRLQEQVQQAQKMEALGRLAGGIAHDFNNLLTVINSYVSFAVDALAADNALRADLVEVKKAGDRAAALTAQLVAFSRRSVVLPRSVDLNRTVVDVEKMLSRLVGEDIVMRRDLASDLWPVSADSGQLEQVLTNLVLNARDAMPAGGALRIETRNALLDAHGAAAHADAAPGRYVTLAVCDQGPGIPPEVLPHMFEPFFTTKGVEGHAGLGLATVYGIVKQGGGFFEVLSPSGGGTTVRVYLPAADAAPEAQSIVEEQAAASPREGAGRLVLLVEDAPAVRRVARRILEHHGFAVVEASDGAQALRIAEELGERIDLVLTDVVMPQMGGQALAHRLRETRPDLPVVFMSGYTADLIARRGVLEDGTLVVQKPFVPGELVRRVLQVLSDGARRGRR